MSRQMWYLTRGAGIVAAVLMVLALLWGFLFSSRETGDRLRPAWWLDLHNMLGGLALAFTGLHIVASWLDTSSGIGIAQIFVPGSAAIDPWAITWGVLATYLTAAAVFTTWPRRLRKRPWWRLIHLTSVVGTALALLHSYQSGSDATRRSFRVGLLVLCLAASYGLYLRLFSLDRSKLGARAKR